MNQPEGVHWSQYQTNQSKCLHTKQSGSLILKKKWFELILKFCISYKFKFWTIEHVSTLQYSSTSRKKSGLSTFPTFRFSFGCFPEMLKVLCFFFFFFDFLFWELASRDDTFSHIGSPCGFSPFHTNIYIIWKGAITSLIEKQNNTTKNITTNQQQQKQNKGQQYKQIQRTQHILYKLYFILYKLCSNHMALFLQSIWLDDAMWEPHIHWSILPLQS